jgi:hypothetical protein
MLVRGVAGWMCCWGMKSMCWRGRTAIELSNKTN